VSAEELTLSVSQYIDLVNRVLKESLGEGVWIQGEIEGFNNRTKHTYFNVVERTEGKKASVGVAIWEFNMKRLKPLLDKHRLTLGDGIKVRLYGSGGIYADRGSFTFKVNNIDPRFTLGDLAGQRDEIVQKLKLAGLYDANKRVSLPVVPLRIALLTSIGSAAHADTLHELEASGIGFDVQVYDVRVQGEDAAPTVVAALQQAAKRDDIDLIMLVRGGGSKTDLLAFDTEEIAAAIGKCAKPVFTGIGHEIDFSIADEVAYRAFKTPTACAAGVAEVVNEFVKSTEDAWAQIAAAASELLQSAEHDLVRTLDRIRHRPMDVLNLAAQTLKGASDRLRLLDPVNTMARGWSITRDSRGNTIRNVAQVGAGEQITTQLSDGTLSSTVNT
jgi:exodeoxyribonuclease VII large subunit